MHDYARLYENIPDYAISMAYYAILVAYSASMPYLWHIMPYLWHMMYVCMQFPYIRKNGHDLPSHSKLKDKHYHGESPTDSSSESTQEEGAAPGQA